MGRILVDVCGQEVLHGGRVQHDGAGSVSLMGGVVDVVEGAEIGGFAGEWKLRDLDAWYWKLLLSNPWVLRRSKAWLLIRFITEIRLHETTDSLTPQENCLLKAVSAPTRGRKVV